MREEGLEEECAFGKDARRLTAIASEGDRAVILVYGEEVAVRATDHHPVSWHVLHLGEDHRRSALRQKPDSVAFLRDFRSHLEADLEGQIGKDPYEDVPEPVRQPEEPIIGNDENRVVGRQARAVRIRHPVSRSGFQSGPPEPYPSINRSICKSIDRILLFILLL